MCLESATSSRLGNIVSMENCHLLKECRVVLVPLRDDIARRKTVKVHSIEGCVSASGLRPDGDEGAEGKEWRETETSLPISVYPKIDNGIITEVQCKTFRKRKREVRSEVDKIHEEVVVDVMKCLLDRVAAQPVKCQSIDFASPGVKEIQLIRDFCRENDYESRDYQDLKGLFTFITLPIAEAKKLVQSEGKRQKVRKKKVSLKATESPCAKKENEASTNVPSNGLSGSGLEKIENLKIRKILEDFERLSKSEENVQAPKQKKIKTDLSCSPKKKNVQFNKPLNLCKKDNQEIEKPIQISKSVQSDISISGSILRTLLHNEECVKNSISDHSNDSRDKFAAARQPPSESHQKKTTKKSTAQQTDSDSAIVDEKVIIERSQTESNGKNDKWLNDPTAILKKIQKLKKDILYLDLLAEEKEKERIAILCFKNYKESILKKIFASEMSAEVSNNVADSASVAIPKLIHPSGNSVNALIEQRPLNCALYPSSASLVERQNSCSTLPDNPSIHINPINENFVRLGNCIKCDLLKTNFLNPKYRNPWYCNPLCQAHSCIQHAKECRGFVEASSSK